MSHPDQAAIGGLGGSDWRMHLRDMRTLRTLQNGAPAEDEIRRLPDRVLRAAVQNPDHSEAARAAAEAELRARSISADRWRLVVPGFIRVVDLERRGDKLFFGWGAAVRAWSGRFALVSLLALLALIVMQQVALDQSQAIAPSERVGLFLALSSAQSWMYAAGYAALLALTIWLVSSALRRHPARVILLRKLNERHLSSPLDHMLRRELAPYGHVATISDRFIPATLFSRYMSGHGVVVEARDYRNLASRLGNRIALNLRAALKGREAVLVRASEAWWPTTTRLLIDSSDVIVVDLSQLDHGAAWELDMVAAEGAVERCVFVALWGKLEEAEAALAERGISAVVHHYAPDGEIQRRGPFRAAMLAAMRATHHVPA
ncbi:MAG: hypothetical protein K2X34_00635 [Hyphomonadaceae bacterium]|nr:hypothetical protein [Hyphomonadaceae bacterium]